jgi:hypothetical protein
MTVVILPTIFRIRAAPHDYQNTNNKKTEELRVKIKLVSTYKTKSGEDEIMFYVKFSDSSTGKNWKTWAPWWWIFMCCGSSV